MSNRQVMWVNVFVRDLLLSFVVLALQYWTHFNSKIVFLITGMLVVYISWQVTDYINEKRRVAYELG